MPAEDVSIANRYFRHAIQSHWDPYEVDLAADRETVEGLSRRAFTQLRATVAMFGAGEESVTEDLVPLAATVDSAADQRFVASQIYEEAKHATFFDRYWSEVINPVEEARGFTSTSPTADRWFTDAYETVFVRTTTAMKRLLKADTPVNRARAYCHYHLTVEGIFGQTGFHAVKATFGGETDGPSLPGLVDGFEAVEQDEGRHVGYGMKRLGDLLQTGPVERSLVEETIASLAEPVDTVVERMGWKHLPGPDSDDLLEFVAEQRNDRLAQLPAGDDGTERRSVE